jgi:hypothetical protein
MLRRVVVVTTDVPEELSPSFFRVTRISELGTTLFLTLMKEMLSSFEKSFLTRATWRNTPEHTIRHSHRREYIKSYIITITFIELPTF